MLAHRIIKKNGVSFCKKIQITTVLLEIKDPWTFRVNAVSRYVVESNCEPKTPAIIDKILKKESSSCIHIQTNNSRILL